MCRIRSICSITHTPCNYQLRRCPRFHKTVVVFIFWYIYTAVREYLFSNTPASCCSTSLSRTALQLDGQQLRLEGVSNWQIDSVENVAPRNRILSYEAEERECLRTSPGSLSFHSPLLKYRQFIVIDLTRPVDQRGPVGTKTPPFAFISSTVRSGLSNRNFAR